MASLVYLKHKNGTTYVYENVSFWDKKSKKPKSKRKCIGHLDPETGAVQPNPDKPEKILQFLHISSTIKKNVGGCVHVTYR